MTITPSRFRLTTPFEADEAVGRGFYYVVSRIEPDGSERLAESGGPFPTKDTAREVGSERKAAIQGDPSDAPTMALRLAAEARAIEQRASWLARAIDQRGEDPTGYEAEFTDLQAAVEAFRGTVREVLDTPVQTEPVAP